MDAIERADLIQETFVELADTLASEYDLGEFLHLLVERCARILEVYTGGVLLETPAGDLRLAAAITEEMKVLEGAELSNAEGPCIDAYVTGDQVLAEDLRQCSDRWPQTAPHAVDIGLLAVYAFPLQLRGDRICALNL